MPKLVVMEGPNRGVVLPLRKRRARIGRAQGLEVTLPDRHVSRLHAELEHVGDGLWVIKDLGSTNATYVNGVRVTHPRSLTDGDEMRVGETVLVYVDRPDEDGKAFLSSGAGEETGRLVERDVEGPPTVIAGPRFTRGHSRYMVGKSRALEEVSELVERCAPLDTTVLVTGESGTGKELVAEALHRLSGRRQEPFLVINCATLEPALLESDLFGHERGSFTGAVARKVGKLELVKRGTLFLDEVGELPLGAQAKLLRAIDRREFLRVGGNEVLRANARFVAATHRDLNELVREGKFREDLLFRLRVVEIKLPPLRERTEDIEPLVKLFIEEMRARIPTRVGRLNEAALATLERYAFPGNVRELRNVVERCLIFCRKEEVGPEDLPREVRVQAEPATDSASSMQTLEETERSQVERALERANWNKSAAARILGIDRTTLYAKIKRYGITQ
jgi:DNA-binding NtrC family response regulator